MRDAESGDSIVGMTLLGAILGVLIGVALTVTALRKADSLDPDRQR